MSPGVIFVPWGQSRFPPLIPNSARAFWGTHVMLLWFSEPFVDTLQVILQMRSEWRTLDDVGVISGQAIPTVSYRREQFTYIAQPQRGILL